jgi:mycothiol synthase
VAVNDPGQSTLTRDEVAEPIEALRVIFAQPGASRAESDQQVQAFCRLARRQHWQAGQQWLVKRDGAVRAACILVVSPGGCGTALLSVPGHREDRAALVQGLTQLVTEARRADLRMVQALLEPGSGAAELLSQAGFELLSTLLYMERDADRPFEQPPHEGLGWASYDADTHATFAEVIKQSYEATMDCPGLDGVRSIEEVIEAHKASGIFEPKAWRLLLRTGQAVGVLLLNRVVYASAMEIVYMGVTPAARGLGLGRVLVAQAIREARQRRVQAVSLAVDAANLPARRVYESFDFATRIAREAWVKTLRRADGRPA